MAYSTLNFNKILKMLTEDFNPNFVSFIFTSGLFTYYNFIVIFIFVIWNPSSIEIGML